MDVLKGLAQLDTDSIDLIITSPPYNIGIAYDVYSDAKRWDWYYEWCGKWLKELHRVIKKDGRFCLNHYLSLGTAIERTGPLMNLNHISEKLGFKHHALAIWWDTSLSKKSAWGSWLSASAPYVNSPFEGILVLYKEQWKKEHQGESTLTKKEFMESCSGVWKIPPEKERDHPAPFPEKLATRCINMFSYVGDLVLDPFMGSGTTAFCAIKNRRNFIGFDISKDYVARANKRAETMLNQSRIDRW